MAYRGPTPDGAVRLRALHAARIVVPYAAGRFPLVLAGPRHHVQYLGVAPHARPVLGAEMYQVRAPQPDPNVARFLMVYLVGRTGRGTKTCV